MEHIGSSLARTAASSLTGFFNPSDKLLTSANPDKQLSARDINTAELLRQALPKLPVNINPQFEYAVVGYIQHFGWQRVYRWALKAVGKRDPERWFMTVMRRERYGK